MTTSPGTAIVRVDGGIFYANADAVKDQIDDIAWRANPPVQQLIVDLDNVPGLDLSALHMLGDLAETATEHNARLILLGATASVREALARDGLAHLLARRDAPSTINEVLAGS